MTSASLLAYALALLLAVATPGPAMISVTGRGFSQGPKPALLMAAGIAIADCILGALALLGLATLMTSSVWLVTIIKFAGAAYLIWLGIRMWRAPAVYSAKASGSKSHFLLGMTVGLSNPKAILFHASMMPIIIDLRLLDRSSAAAILAIIFCANLLGMGAYAILAGNGSRWFRTPERLAWLNRVGSGSMLGAGALIVVR
ncbi:MAG TPA: LysE family translocator [Sphingomicrobium sp.]|nr:LysE family translocator [Sphingomicrobium sp.]